MLTKSNKLMNITKVNTKDQDKRIYAFLNILVSFYPQIMDDLELLVFY